MLMATVYRKLGLSGINSRRKAAEKEGKVHSIRNIRQLVTSSEPKVNSISAGITNKARRDTKSIPTNENDPWIMRIWLRCLAERNSAK